MHSLFAWRYFKAKKTTNAINVISWISIVAMLFGTAALILVLSVFNGFEDLVKGLYSSFYPDVKIVPASGKNLSLTAEQLQTLRSVKGVKALSLVVEERAFLKNGEAQSMITLKGVDSAYKQVTTVAEHIVNGEFNTGTSDKPLLVLGYGIENAVAVQADRNIFPLTVYLPRKGEVDLSDPLKSLATDTVNTSGSFLIQQDFDNKYVLTNLGFVKTMLNMPPDAYGAAEIAVNNPDDAKTVQVRLQRLLGKDYMVQTRYEQNKSLYSIMQMEKWVIYAILSLILVVAAFNMIGALTMLVLEKREDIGVLHAIGASRNFIKRIFLSEGLLLATIGGGGGMLLALLIAWAQLKFHLVPLQGDSFLISYFPVKINPWDFLLVGTTVLVISLIAAYIPARKAARQQLVLRSE
ncbi:FtsX-like permease family protein [Flavisolibacter ginsenosidimutans]|uniref:ABC transporter permease n=1 Tax=Flavisolibacter ginsenosidimutans TaxID=661481 RepID=A0A5B8UPG2_9BACT|nr:FtsX-like permease family protein [Flavisolibacter ginsenosidimutans]QEC57845.1 ABC transporter permease [Flavisolibacter ginsenosidimutans]